MLNTQSYILEAIKGKSSEIQNISPIERVKIESSIKFYMGIGYFAALSILIIKLFI
ncbi:hypothetical protein BMS3Abin04_01950 [bacterium BMS3Abin04]|nr:hypothetical protein BMS3Abin04_01950 [bacterium BMS3Abin04]